jgi:hypothetical protein
MYSAVTYHSKMFYVSIHESKSAYISVEVADSVKHTSLLLQY